MQLLRAAEPAVRAMKQSAPPVGGVAMPEHTAKALLSQVGGGSGGGPESDSDALAVISRATACALAALHAVRACTSPVPQVAETSVPKRASPASRSHIAALQGRAFT